jgi:L-ascorbate metabolism protein UlaG (beta-lactamase superfamily)
MNWPKSFRSGLAGILAVIFSGALSGANPVGAAKTSPPVRVDYLAHACFVIHSPEGKRIVIDPYNSHIWMGYQFPVGTSADAVLVTHPHFDHDADYYFPVTTPVFRTPGSFRIGDVCLTGVAGEHGNAEAMRQRQLRTDNTIWIIETGGLRIVHAGDNGALSPALAEAIGPVDIFLGMQEFPPPLQPRIVIPMHYLLPDVSGDNNTIAKLDPWLARQSREVVRRDASTVAFSPGTLPAKPQIHVLPHSPQIKPWPDAFRRAMREAQQAQALRRETGVVDHAQIARHFDAAIQLAPGVIAFYRGLAQALIDQGRSEDAVAVLERGLAVAGRDDWASVVNTRALLARTCANLGKTALAEIHYRHLSQLDAIYLSPALSQEIDRFLHSAPADH